MSNIFEFKRKKENKIPVIKHNLAQEEVEKLRWVCKWYNQVLNYPNCKYRNYHYTDITNIFTEIFATINKNYKKALTNNIRFGNLNKVSRILFFAFQDGLIPGFFESELNKIKDGKIDKFYNSEKEDLETLAMF